MAQLLAKQGRVEQGNVVVLCDIDHPGLVAQGTVSSLGGLVEELENLAVELLEIGNVLNLLVD